MKLKSIILLSVICALFTLTAGAEEPFTRYEFEAGTIVDCSKSEIIGESGFVGMIDNAGASVTLDNIRVNEDGVYLAKIVYVACIEGRNSHSIFVNGEYQTTAEYDLSPTSWGAFDQEWYYEVELTLKKGANTIKFEKAEDDEGFAQLESLHISAAPVPETTATPEPTETPEPANTPASTQPPAASPVKTEIPEDNGNRKSNVWQIAIATILVIIAALIVIYIILRQKK